MLSLSEVVAFYHQRGQYRSGVLIQDWWTFTYFQTLEKNLPGWTISSIDSEPVKAQSLIDIGECFGHCRADNNE